MSDILIVIPTYDEKDNIKTVIEAVFDSEPSAEILFVDDNSPDGTGEIIEQICKTDSRIHIIHHPYKMGLGRAYVDGFKWALLRDYEFIFEMDADLSHDPRDIPRFLEAIRDADVVLGSRYLGGIRIINWPLRRLILSKTAAVYVRLMTGMPVTDPTGGYKCYRRHVLESINLDSVRSNGYSFQVEMSFLAWRLGFRIKEIPITFVDRRSGYSKMNAKILKEAIWIVWRLGLKSRFSLYTRRSR